MRNVPLTPVPSGKQTIEVKNRGYGFLIPLGKMLTQHEEKNDVRSFFLFLRSARPSRSTGVLIPFFDDRFSLGSQRI
jgi:hypothetical protein